MPAGYLDCHNFNPGGTDTTSGMTIPAGASLVLDLQWPQPRGGVTTDLDVCVVDAGTGSALACAADANDGPGGTQLPFEAVGYKNTGILALAVNVVVARYSGPAVRFKWVQLGRAPGSVEYSTSVGTDVFGPTIFGHSGAANAFSVGAVPFNNSTTPEPYSSAGPVTMLFNPVPSTTPLPAAQILAKPDMAATDCVQNSFFPPGSPSPHRFCGTSDAAPHAAAVAALMLQARPGGTPAQIGSALLSTARAVGSAPAAIVGAGLVDAQAAVLGIAGQAPAIATANGTAFTVGMGGSFTVIATGVPTPPVSMSGTLPGGVSFNSATRLLSGTSAAGSAGTYNLTFTAANGILPNATQSFTLSVKPAPHAVADFDGDARTDFSVYRPTTGGWYIQGQAGSIFGTNGDVPVPADYDGDQRTDVAVFRPSNGGWYIQGQAGSAWGQSGDVPEPGDYNSDGTTDVAVYRPSAGAWYVVGGPNSIWGTSTDLPQPLPDAIRRSVPGA